MFRKIRKITKISEEIKELKSECQTCGAVFSIAHGGAYDMFKHLQSIKHKSAENSAGPSKVLTRFLKSSTLANKDLEIAASEVTWVFHTTKENQNFRSHDSTSKLFENVLSPNLDVLRQNVNELLLK
ncbi:hypothetical protein ANN_02963 [Periplaneta americana]|uniref:BED-type domain-containing protein n=1 Tax=Periplaneta americana TaxID=6978 RepID=A0ABQ8U2F6_PERAM|nr:hypothetical protein ANN_02963 [Periplaneta americana]